MLGFVIISHDNPDQLVRLCRALGALYDRPPIVCHHDFTRSSIDQSKFADNVCFVDEPAITGWAEWGVTAGLLKAIDLLYSRHDPEWFTLLSAADYPIKPASVVRTDLEQCGVDALMDLRPIGAFFSPARHEGCRDPSLAHHDNQQLAARRYLHARMNLAPSVNGRQPRSIRLPFQAPFGPFTNDYLCYVGSLWFTANRRAAAKLINLSERDRATVNYMKRRWHATESFVHSVLGNCSDISIDLNSRRFARWTKNAANPNNLGLEDLPDMLASTAHFARKFVHGSPVLDQLDKLMLKPAQVVA